MSMLMIWLSNVASAQTKEDSLNFKTVAGRWSVQKATTWYNKQPWLVGCNYLPATAINQIEMWQASTFDPITIDKELGWAESIGMNTLRVFLHDMVWASDKAGFYQRMDEFLRICQKHKIRPFFVFFDDCHFPNPQLGVQPLPVRNYHNSGWVNCPARDVAHRFATDQATPAEVAQLKEYVQETMRHFAQDKRVLMWELYNEPGRGNNLEGLDKEVSFGNQSKKLVYQSWVWARAINPSQPVTSCTLGSLGNTNIYINHINADIYSIHSYQNPELFEKSIVDYKQYGRPMIMTEWLARTQNNTVQNMLPILKKYNVGAVNWGFVSGKSGTVWPWSSRRENGKPISVNAKRATGEVLKEGDAFPEPALWFHDIFRTDGSPFDPKEIETFKALTGKNK